MVCGVRVVILGFNCRFRVCVGIFVGLMFVLNLCCTGDCLLNGCYLEFVFRYVFD